MQGLYYDLQILVNLFSILLLLKQVKELEEQLEKQGGSIGSLLHLKVCFLSVLVGFFNVIL